MFGSAENEHPRLTRPNREIIFEEFQLQSTNVTDRRTDTQTTCDRKISRKTGRRTQSVNSRPCTSSGWWKGLVVSAERIMR